MERVIHDLLDQFFFLFSFFNLMIYPVLCRCIKRRFVVALQPQTGTLLRVVVLREVI